MQLGINMTGFEVSHPSSRYRKDFDTLTVTQCLDNLFEEWDALRHNFSTLCAGGFKRNEEFIRYHGEHRFHIIYLSREPSLERSISEQLAIRTAMPMVDTAEQRVDFLKRTKDIVLDIDELKRHLKGSKWLKSGIEPLLREEFVKWIRYEELYNVSLAQTMTELAEVCDFLSISLADVAKTIFDPFLPHRKQTDSKVLKQIANLDEIEAAFGVALI